jgi:hypothetical protein
VLSMPLKRVYLGLEYRLRGGSELLTGGYRSGELQCFRSRCSEEM